MRNKNLLSFIKNFSSFFLLGMYLSTTLQAIEEKNPPKKSFFKRLWKKNPKSSHAPKRPSSSEEPYTTVKNSEKISKEYDSMPFERDHGSSASEYTAFSDELFQLEKEKDYHKDTQFYKEKKEYFQQQAEKMKSNQDQKSKEDQKYFEDRGRIFALLEDPSDLLKPKKPPLQKTKGSRDLKATTRRIL